MKPCPICGPATAPGCEQHVAPSRPSPSISALLVRWKVPLDPHLQRDALIERLRAVEEAWGIPAAVLALPEPNERGWEPWVDRGVREGDVEPTETTFNPECCPMHTRVTPGCQMAVRTETAAVVDMIAQRDISAGEAVTCRGALSLPEPPAPLLREFAEDLRAGATDPKAPVESIRADAEALAEDNAALRITVGTLRAADERSRRTIAEQAAEIGRLRAERAEAKKPLCGDPKCSTCLRGNR